MLSGWLAKNTAPRPSSTTARTRFVPVGPALFRPCVPFQVDVLACERHDHERCTAEGRHLGPILCLPVPGESRGVVQDLPQGRLPKGVTHCLCNEAKLVTTRDG
jgi:hypothetical protein